MTSFWVFWHCATLTEYFKVYKYFFQLLPIVVFGLVRLFSQIFQMSPKGPPSFFLFFQRMDVQKLPNAPFYICRHYATYRGAKKIQKKFQFFFIFFLFFPHVGFVEENT